MCAAWPALRKEGKIVMKTRIISGAVLAALCIAVILAGGPVLMAALLFCSVVGMFELMSAGGVIESGRKVPPVAIAAWVGAAVYYLVLYFAGMLPAEGVSALAVLAIMAAYVLSFSDTKADTAVWAGFSFVYVAYMLSFIYKIRVGENGVILVWLVFLSSWAADTCAYFTGVFLGRHKMTPVLSPKKTWEGAAGGVLGAGVCGILFTVFFNGHRDIWQYFVICAAGAVISIFGDLAASAIKRDRNIKDYGWLIPGHGGIMDRFDSVIFTAPVIYLLTTVLLGST